MERGFAHGRWMRVLVAVLLALGATLTATVTPAQALERRTTGDVVVVSAGQVVQDDLLAAGRLVRIDGTVLGDVYAFGQNVTVTGMIEGDLIAAAQQVVIEGQVQGNARVAGAGVQVNGAVGRNVTAAAQLVQLGRNGRVAGSWMGAGETLSLAGDVGGALTGTARDVIMQGRVGRNAEVAVSSLTVAPTARIDGDLTYHAEQELEVPAQAVAGRIRYERAEGRRESPASTAGQAFSVLGNLFSLAWLVGSAGAGIALLRLFPRFAATFLGVLQTRPLLSLGAGALAVIATLPLAVLIALTLIGIPLTALLVAGYFSGMFVGWLLLAMAVGSILVGLARRRPLHHIWSFLLGLIVLYVASRLPVLGGVVTFTGLSLGLGALVIALYRAWQGTWPPAPSPVPAAPAMAASAFS